MEGFGVLNLFGNMFPMAFTILRALPVIGPIVSHSEFGRISKTIATVIFIFMVFLHSIQYYQQSTTDPTEHEMGEMATDIQ